MCLLMVDTIQGGAFGAPFPIWLSYSGSILIRIWDSILISFLIWFNYHYIYLTCRLWFDSYFIIRFDSLAELREASFTWLISDGNNQVDWAINSPRAWVHEKMKMGVSNFGVSAQI